jgi:hypothetical protein
MLEADSRAERDEARVAPEPVLPRADAIEHAIDVERVRHLVRQAPTGIVTGILTFVAIVAVLWNEAPREWLLVWSLMLGALSIPTFVVPRRIERATDLPERIAYWRRALIVVYGLAGAGWGTAALVLYPRVSMEYQLFLLFVLGGSGVGGMAALAPVRAVMMAYLTATFFPVIGVLLAGGRLSSVATGLLLLTFWAAAISLGTEMRRLLRASLALRFENLDLIDDLAKKNAADPEPAKSLLANVSQ